MGKVVAKIMRDAKEGRKMSDGGVGGDVGVSDADTAAGLLGLTPGEAAELGATTPGLSAETGQIGGGPGGGGPGTGIGPGGMEPAVSGGEPPPITPGVTPAVAETPKTTPKAPAIERKRRRRSLLSQEEGGLAEDGGIQRRSILGR